MRGNNLSGSRLVRHGYCCLCLVLACTVPALAQCADGTPSYHNLTIAHPEGSLPDYITAAHMTYPCQDNDPCTPNTTAIISKSVAYEWHLDGKNAVERSVIAASGPTPFDQTFGAYAYDLDLTPQGYLSFGDTGRVKVYSRYGCTAIGSGNTPPYCIGSTVVRVHTSGGLAVPNAVLHLGLSTDGVSTVADFTEDVPLTPNVTDFTVGQPVGGNPVAPYCPGLATDRFLLYITAPGYNTSQIPGSIVGNNMVGQGFDFTMTPLGSPTVTPVQSTTPTSGSGTVTCTAADQVFPSSDSGGGPGFAWNDTSFPSSVIPSFLHTGNWTETVNVTVAGQYTITGDCATASNMGTVTLTVGSTAGTPVNCNSSAAGAHVGAALGTFTLAAGANTLSFALTGGTYAAVHAVHLTPTVNCGSSGSGSGGSIFDLDGFFARLKQFVIDCVTPDPTDVDNLRAAGQRLFTWGPFGLPSQVQAIWASASVAPARSDPHYWWFPLTLSALTAYQIQTVPLGYQVGVTDAGAAMSANNRIASAAVMGGYRAHYYVAGSDSGGRPLVPSAVSRPATDAAPGTSMDINLWARLIPDHWDFAPYSTFVLTCRGIEWAAAWLGFMWYLKNKFTPDLKI